MKPTEEKTRSNPSDLPVYLFKQGNNCEAYRYFGAHIEQRAGETGVVFRVWAPHATAISVVGDFNSWKPGSHPMRKVDNDFGRTARQRKLMELLLEKVLDGGMSMTELNNLLNACMPYVQTNMKASTLFDLALGVLRSGISDRLTRGESLLEQHHVPMDGTYSYLDVDGASVINMGSKSFPKNVRALHEFIYGEYIPAD